MSIRRQVRNGTKTILTLDEYRALKDEPREKKVDYEPKAVLTDTMEGIIVGFDPDVDSSGVAVYDAKRNEVLFCEEVELRYIYEWLKDFKNEMEEKDKLKKVFCRLELTNEGVVNRLNDYMEEMLKGKVTPATIEKRKFMRIWNSAQNARVGFEIEKELRRGNVKYELIDPSRRLSIKNRRLEGKDGGVLESMWRKDIIGGGKKWRIFPTKMTSKQVEYFFGKVNGKVNSETIDALGLAIPELLINKMRGVI